MQEYLQSYIQRFSKQEQEEIKIKYKSQRAELTDEIYKIYLKHHKRENIKRFLSLFENNLENQKKFKNSKNYYPPFDIRRFCFRLSHIPTEDLFYILSIAKDKDKRRENFAVWIMWATKA